MAQGSRPLGVTVLAVLYFIGVATYAVLLALATFAPGHLRAVLQGLSPGGSGPAWLLALGWALPLYFGVMALVVGALGYGMLQLKNWARLVTMLVSGLSLAGVLFSLRELVMSVPAVAMTGLRIGLCVAWLWYLSAQGVRAAFRPKSVS